MATAVRCDEARVLGRPSRDVEGGGSYLDGALGGLLLPQNLRVRPLSFIFSILVVRILRERRERGFERTLLGLTAEALLLRRGVEAVLERRLDAGVAQAVPRHGSG